jgi:glycosyltransferase involved in cell wall biosynthesis
VDAALWFVREVLPLIRAQQPAAHLLLVGRSPSPAVRALHDGAAVRVLPDVPDVRPFIAGAAAYVVPMRIGGGVRLKLLEALAMQAAVVSTRMGAEGLPDLRGDEHLLLADTPRAFAAAVLRLLDDAALRQRLGAAGRALAQRYDWRAIVPRLEQVYQS